LSVIDVAFASGFASLRQFNRQFREQYRLTPSALRKGEKRRAGREPNVLLKLGFRAPFAFETLVRFLVGRSGVGTEIFNENGYLRTVRLGRATGFIRARVLSSALLGVEISPSLLRALPELRARLRRLFDLDADPVVIDRRLGKETELRRSVKLVPGLRVPGALSGFELALRTVLGQQISVKAATTIYGRFVDTFGARLETPEPSVDRVAPDASDVANATLQQLIDRGLTRRRAESVRALAIAVAEGALQLAPPADFASVRAALSELPGFGPWTTEYILMRALGDPDAFPHSDLGLLQATGDATPAALLARAEAFRPYRAYAALRLWHGASGG
jgi:AraC family transcriptional regulator of adaptative response / DNA-3-methyladenine glycosylase II